MLKSVKAFSLILCCSSFISLDSKELEMPKGGESEFKTQVSQKFDEISGQSIEVFNSGIAAMERLKSSRDEAIPESLIPLNETLNELSYQVETDPNPDNIDIILLLDANGKTQTLALMYFLRELENALKISANKSFPGSDLKLFSVIDSFVGEGSGAIPAAVCALGTMTIDEAIKIVQKIPSELLYPKSLYGCCGCCFSCRNFTKAAVSAYLEKPELIDEDNSQWISLYYNAFKPGRKYDEGFRKLYGVNSISDLKSSFETISLNKNSSSIAEIVSHTISSRDREARSSIKRMGLTEILLTAESSLTAISDIKEEKSEKNEELSSAVKCLSELKIVLHQSANEKNINITGLRKHIMQKIVIPRDMLIISVMSDTCREPIMIPTFSYNIRATNNGKKIINMNYKIAIPEYLYTPKKKEIESYDESVHDSVRSVFPESSKETNISKATEKLVEFLNKCNDRVLAEF